MVATLAVAAFASAALAGTNVTGKVNFKGTPPAAKPIKMNADPKCMALHAKPLSTDYVLVNGNGTLKNVFVYIKDGLTGKTFTSPTTPVTFDQRGCFYSPHVFGIQVGQPFEIINSDPTMHNVHAMPKNSPQFNAGMPVQNMKITKKFDKPEIGAKIKCDVHPWMGAWANVVDHPYYSVTGDDGTFTIKDVPAGTYTVGAWHEKYGTQEAKLTVTDGKPATVDFTYEAGKETTASR